MRRSLGSLKAAWIWLVKAPGVKRPAMEEQPMYLREILVDMVALVLRWILNNGCYRES